MVRLIFNGAPREVVVPGSPLDADNLDDPGVHLLAMGLVEGVDGRLRATQAWLRPLETDRARTAMNVLCDTHCGPGTARWMRRTPER